MTPNNTHQQRKEKRKKCAFRRVVLLLSQQIIYLFNNSYRKKQNTKLPSDLYEKKNHTNRLNLEFKSQNKNPFILIRVFDFWFFFNIPQTNELKQYQNKNTRISKVVHLYFLNFDEFVKNLHFIFVNEKKKTENY